jgi:hypothetical protein
MPHLLLIIIPENVWVTKQLLKHLEMSFKMLQFLLQLYEAQSLGSLQLS